MVSCRVDYESLPEPRLPNQGWPSPFPHCLHSSTAKPMAATACVLSSSVTARLSFAHGISFRSRKRPICSGRSLSLLSIRPSFSGVSSGSSCWPNVGSSSDSCKHKYWHHKFSQYYWPFVKGIHRSPVDSPHKGPLKQSFAIFLVVILNKLLSKLSRCQWFEMPWHWCHFTVMTHYILALKIALAT